MASTFVTTQSGASADYMKYIYGDMVKTDRVNAPALLDFTLHGFDANFVKLVRGSYVTITTDTYGTWFTGYITDNPEMIFLGTSKVGGITTQQWGLRYQAASDDVILNLKPIGIVPPFVNTTQGEIIRRLVNILAPQVGFDVTNVQDGPTVSRYVVDPQNKFGDVLNDLGASAYFKFSAQNKTLYYVPQDSVAAAIEVNGTSKHFTPARLTIQPVTDPIINDAIIVGAIEPQAFITEYFIGDGLTAQFPLVSSVYGSDSSILLDDDFSGSSIDSSKWVVFDDINNWIKPSNGFVNFVGGSNDDSFDIWLQSANLIPLEGNLRITHGEFDFVTASSGVIAGLWTQDPNSAYTGCVYGIEVSKDGSDTVLKPIIQGVVDPSNSLTVDYTKRYIMRTIFQSSRIYRTTNGYGFRDINGNVGVYGGVSVGTGGSLTDGYGESLYGATYGDPSGSGVIAGAIQYAAEPVFRTIITEIDITTGEQTNQWSWISKATLNVEDTFANYIPAAADDLHCTFTGITISTPMQAALSHRLTTADNFVPQLVGPNELDALDGMAPVATIVDSNTGAATKSSTLGRAQYNPGQAVLNYFKNSSLQTSTIPAEKDFIKLQYRSAGATISRVQNRESIDAEAAVWGDDGIRSITRGDIDPPPRNSDEARMAAAALIADSSYQHFQGTYEMPSGEWFSGEPVSGTMLKFHNLSPLFPFTVQAEEINEVSSIFKRTSAGEFFDHTITFGRPDNTRRFMSKIKKITDVFTPQDSAEIPSAVDLSTVATVFGPDVTNAGLDLFGLHVHGVDDANIYFTTNQGAPYGQLLGSDIVVDGKSAPWQFTGGINSAYTLDTTGASAPTSVAVTAGDTICLVRTSGQVSLDDDRPFTDADGDITRPNGRTTTFPGKYVQGECKQGALIGAWADGTGQLVDDPFLVGNGGTFTVPVGATQLLLGVNDAGTSYADNTGSYTMKLAVPNGGFEVRHTDESWGAESGKNLIGRFTSRMFSVPRNAQGKIVCIKAYDIRNYLLHSEDFTDTDWVKSSGVTVDTELSANADNDQQIVSVVSYPAADAGSDVSQLSQVESSVGLVTVFTVDVKGTAGVHIRLEITDEDGSSSSTQEVILTGQWQRVSVTHTFGTVSASPVKVSVANLSTSALDLRVSRASLETGTTTETVYCKTTTIPYGALSQYPAIVKYNVPLIPPAAPSATVDLFDLAAPVISVALPTVLTDVCGVEIRASDNTTVLYHDSLANSGTDVKITVHGNVDMDPSFYVYLYNLLGEFSQSYHLTADGAYYQRVPGVAANLLGNPSFDINDNAYTVNVTRAPGKILIDNWYTL